MVTADLLRQARLRAGITQAELGRRVGRTQSQIARWERGVVQPSFETLRELVRACGFELEVNLAPYAVDERESERLRTSLLRSPQERLQAMLRERSR